MIDQKAVIHPSAKIADDVEIGPWTIIGKECEISAGTKIGPHVFIGDYCKIGQRNKIFPYASVGSDPQHLEYRDEPTALEIGTDNVIREFATINRGTPSGKGVTRIGNHNYLMSYIHIAHDCVVQNHIIFANNASIAGHVEIENHAILGPFSAVHQFSRIGSYSFLGRGAKIYKDILPYMLVAGNPGSPVGLNRVGLKRHGFSEDTMRKLKTAFRLLYRFDLKWTEICTELEKLGPSAVEVQNIIDFIKLSKRGIARSPSRRGDPSMVES